jgi:mannonate dehydratase
MNMTWRWFGEGNDSVTLDQVRQVPGVSGIVWSLHDQPAGAEWDEGRIQAAVAQIRAKGFHAEVVESVNVSDAIKIGAPARDDDIDRYIATIEKLGRAGVKVICYNFMPVFDWVRTAMHHPLADGSNALYYQKARAERSARELIDDILDKAGSFSMPGWEPERLAQIEALIASYQTVDADRLRSNLKSFLDRIIPTCERVGVKMALHPDDPPWPIYGLPRIVGTRDQLRAILDLNDSPCHGLTLCSGSLGANPANDIPAMVREFGDRIPFAHIRNVKVEANGDFVETSHKTSDGTVDIRGIVEAYRDIGYTGYVRPDHGRHLWGEEKTCRPGYGLYDRALGIMYLWGLWDAFGPAQRP